MLRQVLIQLGVDPDDDAALRWAVAVRAAHLLWRNTVLEDWHAAGRLHDGEMMRNNSAVVKLIRFYLDPEGTDWDQVAAVVTAADRPLADGRTLGEVGAPDLAALRSAAAAAAANLLDMQHELGVQAVWLRLAASPGLSGNQWHGMPAWPGIVEDFCAAVADPTHEHLSPDQRERLWSTASPPG
jgi:hypothetical protein